MKSDRKLKIVILSFSQIQQDGRVLRQVEYLSKVFQVEVIGYGYLPPPFADKTKMHSIQPPSNLTRRGRKSFLLPLGRLHSSFYDAWYWSEQEFKEAFKLLVESDANAIHANDWEALPVAVKASKVTGAKVVVDLHEYAPLLREDRRYWKMFYKPSVEYFLRKYLHLAAAVVTVNRALANRYAQEYKVEPLVIMNAPQLKNPPPFRAVTPHSIRLIHHGYAHQDRHLELMIDAIAQTDERFSLNLMLLESSSGYLEALKDYAHNSAPGRVFFHEPVYPGDIVDKIAEFDLGIFLLPAQNFNHLMALPNKFFEFVMAGLGVFISSSPEMARLVNEYGFGVVTPAMKPAVVAGDLNNLSADCIDRMKQKAIEARQSLNADVELEKLIGLYRNFIF